MYTNQDQLFYYDEKEIERHEREQNSNANPKYLSEIKISALAAMKMLKHALTGVAEGQASPSGKPFEIMGVLIGKPDKGSIVVMDTCPLPVKGCETSVLGADENFTNFLIEYTESLEKRRPERLVGWYHSHPFDLSSTSHCFLSNIDCQSQYAWQQQLKSWVAIVVDPLRSVFKHCVEIGAYRCWPVNYSISPTIAPDGTENTVENITTRWGSSYQRYYCMNISYFTSDLSRKLIKIMSQKHLWIHILAEANEKTDYSDKINNVIKKDDNSISEIVIEQLIDQTKQVCKDKLFNKTYE